MKSLLLVKASSLGDIAQTLFAVEKIARHYPDLKIDWVVEENFKGFLERVPFIRNLKVISTKKWRKAPFKTTSERASFIQELQWEEYDLCIDLQGNIKSSWVLFHTKAKNKVGFSFFSVPEKINYFFTDTHIKPPKGQKRAEDYLFLLSSFFPIPEEDISLPLLLSLSEQEERDVKEWEEKWTSLKGSFKVILAPFSNWINKELTPLQIKEIIKDLIHKKDAKFLILSGSEKEREKAFSLMKGIEERALVLDRAPFPVVQHLFTKASLLLTMDSFPLHLAQLAGIKTFSFFGPSSAKVYVPPSDKMAFFQGECPYEITFEKRCPYLRTCPTGGCLKDKAASLLLSKIEEAE